jgi:7,8-dihydroneopterin aldolase/epimerase/oxygenase
VDEEQWVKTERVDIITIQDLGVLYQVGVPEEERSKPQRLLLTVEMRTDFKRAVENDDIKATIDYFQVSQRLLKFGSGRTWKLIETLAVEIAEMILKEFGAKSVVVEIKKFIIPEARYVSVKVNRERS